MSQLLRQLQESGVVEEQSLQMAVRRQQIYGGSLDSVLLELDLIDPVVLDAQLAAANHCESTPVELLGPDDRPWEALPTELTELGWAMPLRRHEDRIQVAIHPEISAEHRALLERSVPNVQVFVTCEACLAKLSAERTGGVMPQRYAVLALTWIHGLRRSQVTKAPQPTAAPVTERAVAAPWMTAPASVASTAAIESHGRSAGPIADARPAPTPPEPKPVESKLVESKPGTQSQRDGTDRTTWRYGMDVADDDESEPGQSRTPTAKLLAAPPPILPPLPQAVLDPDLSVPLSGRDPDRADSSLPPLPDDGYVDPLAGLDDERPAPAASRTPTLAERLIEPRLALEAATGRDEATDALVRAAMVLSPRVGLFGIKKEGLRGLVCPGEIAELVDQVIDVSPELDAAIAGRTPLEATNDLDLRMAVGQERPVPCVFLAIRVSERPVLMLYLDRAGEPFSSEERVGVAQLCELAGQVLHGVLIRLRAGEPAKPATKPKPAAPEPSPAPVPATAPPPTPSRTMTSFGPPGQATDTPSAGSGSSMAASGELSSRPTGPELSSRSGSRPEIGPTKPTLTPIRPPAMTPASLDPSRVAASSSMFAPPSLPGRPQAGVSVDKPPVRLQRTAAPSPPTPPPIEATRPGLTALATPLGATGPAPDDSATIRGRIQLDDEDRPRTSGPTTELDSAITAAQRGGASAIMHLRQFGDVVLQRIASQFPGELDVHRRDLDTLPPLPAHGSLIRVALELGRELGPFLIEVMDHPNPNTRFYSAFIFQELRDDRAVPSLGELAFDPDADVRAIAMRVLETYSGEPPFPTAVALIRRELDSPNRTRQLHATRAVGTLRDIQGVSKLIELLSSKERYIQEAALESLCSITGQQLGLKPHRWKSWYADNAHHHRVEWIMSSLGHKDLSVRRWAGDELRRITGQRIMFPAAGTKQEREIGLQKWVDWWRDEGRAKSG